jgi:CRISPR/Cas system CSM-associated protein Csm2 small subunit
MWARAEVVWDSPSGQSCRASATIEDTSPSGACLRLHSPIRIGSRLTVKWHREQFSAIAKNCRPDGPQFLLGVWRDPTTVTRLNPSPKTAESSSEIYKEPQHPESSNSTEQRDNLPSLKYLPARPGSRMQAADAVRSRSLPAPKSQEKDSETSPIFSRRSVTSQPLIRNSREKVQARLSEERIVLASQKRNNMQPPHAYSTFWRRLVGEKVPEQSIPKEIPVNKTTTQARDTCEAGHPLLSYEDIYHAAGILNPPSGYGIQKVVDMLNSDRIRDLSNDIKRVSVLMALDAAGASADDVLQDATRRQQALDAYEAGQRRQLEELEARKAQENSQIEAELERLKVHYAERVQRNRDQVEQQKEILRNWKMAMQHEGQRISDVIDLCRKPSASAATASAAGPVTSSSPRTGTLDKGN